MIRAIAYASNGNTEHDEVSIYLVPHWNV